MSQIKIERHHFGSLDRAIAAFQAEFDRIHAADPMDMNIQFPESDIKSLQEVKQHLTDRAATFDLIAHLHGQRAFSARTFVPGERTAGVIDHIRKELIEVQADPHDLSEWVDVILLALDGAWRHGHTPEQIAEAIAAKQARNEARTWPDWRTMPTDKAIEHYRGGERAP